MVARTLRIESSDPNQVALNNIPDTIKESMEVWLSKNAPVGPNSVEVTLKVTLDSADQAAFQAVWGGTQTNDV